MTSRIVRSILAALPMWGMGFLLALTGCYAPPGGGRASVEITGQDDYVYYPGYEVYYSNTRHNYVYRDGNSWVTRREPPRAWANEFPKAPSVHVDFHDAPEKHHVDVVKKYPKNWKPEAAPRPENHDDHRDDHHDNDNDHHDRH